MKNQNKYVAFIERSYQLYEQKMYQAAYRILHDSGLAEDAVQEAFLKLMKSSAYFENPESDDCKRYMITVIKHAAIDIYNRRKKENTILFFSDEDSRMEDTAGPDPLRIQMELEDIISRLPGKYSVVVENLVIRGLTVRETAQTLNLTEAAVRKRYERAIKMLKAVQKGSGTNETGKKLYKSNIS